MDFQTDNKIIAEFLGLEIETWEAKDRLGDDTENDAEYAWDNGFAIPVEELNYNSEWYCLMPVVQKIVDTKPPEGPEFVEGYYFRTFGMKDEQGNYMVRINGFSCHKAETLIEATYLAVVEFVKNYK